VQKFAVLARNGTAGYSCTGRPIGVVSAVCEWYGGVGRSWSCGLNGTGKLVRRGPLGHRPVGRRRRPFCAAAASLTDRWRQRRCQPIKPLHCPGLAGWGEGQPRPSEGMQAVVYGYRKVIVFNAPCAARPG